jgi:hypothetical protein
MVIEKHVFLMLLLVGCIFLFGIASCGHPDVPQADGSDSVYKTSDPSRLYFKNIRSASYHKKAGPERGVDIYTLRAFDTESKSPQLIPQIVDYWLKDKAYLHLMKNDPAFFADTVQVFWAEGDSTGTLVLAYGGNDAQYNFAAKLYRKVVNRAEIHVMSGDGTSVPLFDREPYRNAFITTLRDYYRLTDVGKRSLN